MPNLVLHCGARHVPRDEVESAATPPGSRTWQPIAHQSLLHQVESTLVASGLSIVSQAHALWQDGLRYFGLLEVHNGEAQEDYALVIGLRNSHDKTFPAAIALGNSVFCCDNLSFAGEVTIARRHTGSSSGTCRGWCTRRWPGSPTCAANRTSGLQPIKRQSLTNEPCTT
jgi:hypothetical protein